MPRAQGRFWASRQHQFPQHLVGCRLNAPNAFSTATTSGIIMRQHAVMMWRMRGAADRLSDGSVALSLPTSLAVDSPMHRQSIGRSAHATKRLFAVTYCSHWSQDSALARAVSARPVQTASCPCCMPASGQAQRPTVVTQAATVSPHLGLGGAAGDRLPGLAGSSGCVSADNLPPPAQHYCVDSAIVFFFPDFGYCVLFPD